MYQLDRLFFGITKAVKARFASGEWLFEKTACFHSWLHHDKRQKRFDKNTEVSPISTFLNLFVTFFKTIAAGRAP
ncbi:hypothetical protein [Desulfoluna spongiiphila]|uniref:hypothetical protein n=1 Tax=Desulfoluna spongiiphila TaxID=419481 RepID=UPI00125EC693|nr:hypothetical protein [Desulfoluna spongiiphila]